MWTEGADGKASGRTNCLTFDGPGQGYALWKQQHGRPDWEKVICPVVDYALSRGMSIPNGSRYRRSAKAVIGCRAGKMSLERMAGAIADACGRWKTAWDRDIPQADASL